MRHELTTEQLELDGGVSKTMQYAANTIIRELNKNTL
jgi:hypothetical protein